MADIDDGLLRMQNKLDELSKQEELLAKTMKADDLRRQVYEKRKQWLHFEVNLKDMSKLNPIVQIQNQQSINQKKVTLLAI